MVNGLLEDLSRGSALGCPKGRLGRNRVQRGRGSLALRLLSRLELCWMVASVVTTRMSNERLGTLNAAPVFPTFIHPGSIKKKKIPNPKMNLNQ